MAPSCPICYDDDAAALTKLPCCGKSCCKACLKRWFETEQTTGQPAPTCPLEACRQPLDPNMTVAVGGQPWVAAGTKKRKRETVDSPTQKWLDENTLECGGCQTPLVKSEGCDKLQCLCGYRVCWKCKTPGAMCLCNPGHGFIDNVTGRPQWGPATRAKPEELKDFKQYLEEQKKKDPLEALLGSALHPAFVHRRKRRRRDGQRPDFFSRSMFAPFGASFPFAFSSSALASSPRVTRNNPRVAGEEENAFSKALRLSMQEFDREMARAMRRSLRQPPIVAGKSASNPVWIVDDDNNRKLPAQTGGSASDPVCLSDSDDEKKGPPARTNVKPPPVAFISFKRK